jgi:hypothetical protein
MTKDREFKQRVRTRMEKTGESYTTARARLDDRAGLLDDVARFTKSTPVLRIASYDDAVEHYVDWLGFQLDWEWRRSPGEPVIMAVSRDGIGLMLTEAGLDDGVPARSWVTLEVSDIDAFAVELNSRRPGSATVLVEAPYDVASIPVRDTAGNLIDFQQPTSREERSRREALRETMRKAAAEFQQREERLPTAAELVDLAGRPAGVAYEVLTELATAT